MNIGLDIGYSGVKVVFGATADSKNSFVMPVGVSPVRDMGGFGQGLGGVRVKVGHQLLQAGVEPYMVPGSARILDANYTNSAQYTALFYAVLARVGAPRVHQLVTGLPVHLFQNRAVRDDLTLQLQGTHMIDGERSVVVEHVEVVPQPAGTYVSHLSTVAGGSKAMARQSVVVIDPGYFSVDSVVIKRGTPFPDASTTSTHAMSRVLEAADAVLTREYCEATATPGLFKSDMEQALRQGQDVISIGGRDVYITPFLEDAASQVAGAAIPHIQSSLRNLDFRLDTILLGGGGANLFAPTVREAFPGHRVVVAQHSPMANANGFYLLVDQQ